ncbi:hypothetical protein EOD42_10165 [Rhodovarius crocodyli]|uniref:Uncharacterized protein n=1 Tax=Rhodovarius crocodyli TaxID=1979269 RepID=A0A437MGI8_9PROT|nr:hypothetical protein [Rhodovarius crocodyli]RVT96764.1 hypothetical protein EOD42_10165 [Rhodovarius crocodyli]
MSTAWLVPALAQDSPLRQTGIVVEATAADAVQARERAMVQARRTAYQRMQAATGGSGDGASDSQIESMVASTIIEQERISPTRYVGRVTVVFRGGGGGGGGGVAAVPNPMAGQPASSFLEATAGFSSMREWLELRRRLVQAPPVANVDILGLTVDSARLRLGLRTPGPEAAAALQAAGVTLIPGTMPGEAWRVGLGGG